VEGEELKYFFYAQSQICEYRTQILRTDSDVRTTRTDHISGQFQKTVKNKTPEHRTEEATKALFWKGALIMTSRYPRERAEVDRKKRRAADTTLFRFHVSLVYNRLLIRNNVSNSFRNQSESLERSYFRTK
jgi:hypothetical protein